MPAVASRIAHPFARTGFLVVTGCYWAFTLSDGALRMLVLLHLHAQGQTAWGLALLLLPYEIAGVFTNLAGGFLGARFGLKPLLVTGLLLQAVACQMLAVDSEDLTLGWVMLTQVLSGVAKDFAKTASKSYVRKLAPDAKAGALFRAVAVLTGSKNAIKGFGFFVGGALLATLGFQSTNVAIAVALTGMTALALALLPRVPGTPDKAVTSVFAHDSAVNWLAAARLFLFGSRDAWFAIALPLFLTTIWHWQSSGVGGFLAVWVIGYGLVQSLAPQLTRTDQLAAGMRRTLTMTLALLVPIAMTVVALATEAWADWQREIVLGGLLLYGAVFALCSSLHSWLVVALAGADTVVERVGFYYAANAAGRLVGLLLSGWLYDAWGGDADGLLATLVAASVAVLLAAGMLAPTLRRPH
ncbi:MAG: organoarsenical effux MFS transporter ArsJ [bacterium]|nr:organoarsenical effux MFS transporter ArsJ [bacterium]